MPPHEREQMILEGATRFFAKHGFGANMRDLADECGVSQALIFKYFETKENLVDRVYERTFLQRWRPDWQEILENRDKPLSDRLTDFYLSYLTTVDDYIWIRVALFSGLTGSNLTSRYIQKNVAGLMEIIARELRVERGEEVQSEVSSLDLEEVWLLHSTFIYYLIRKHIFRTSVENDTSVLVKNVVASYLNGALSNEQNLPT